MDEAEQLCDRLVIIYQAKILADGTPRELIERFVEREVVELRFGMQNGDPALEDLGDHVEVLQDRIVIGADDGDAVVDQVHARGLHPETVLVRRSSLEDALLRLTGRRPELTDAGGREGSLAVVGWHAHAYRRMWRGARSRCRSSTRSSS